MNCASSVQRHICPKEPSGWWSLVGNKAGDIVPGQWCQECSSQAYDCSRAVEQSWPSSHSYHFYRGVYESSENTRNTFARFKSGHSVMQKGKRHSFHMISSSFITVLLMSILYQLNNVNISVAPTVQTLSLLVVSSVSNFHYVSQWIQCLESTVGEIWFPCWAAKG